MSARKAARGGNGPAGMLVVDKPAGMTSHDVVVAVRRRLDTRAGHTGTLDPQAFADAIAAAGDGELLAEAEPGETGEGKRRAVRVVAKAEGEPGAASKKLGAADVVASKEAVGAVLAPLPGVEESPDLYLRACAAEFAIVLQKADSAALPRLERMGADLRKMEAARPTDQRVKEFRILVERVLQLLKTGPPR